MTVEIRDYAGSIWVPVRTKPRAEKILAQYCQNHGLIHYLPLRRQAKRYQRRTVERFLPMFPGYIFACLDEDDKQTMLRSNKVASILSVDANQQQRLIAELGEIQRLEDLQQQVELIVQPELAAGKPVRVTHGPLQGLTGVVERRRNQARVSVNVEMLGQSVSVDLDIGEVESEDD